MEKVDINKAHEELMIELFGVNPEDPSVNTVTRHRYTEAMHKVQDKYGLKQGHPQFIEWLFTAVGRSPQICEGKGDDVNDTAKPE